MHLKNVQNLHLTQVSVNNCDNHEPTHTLSSTQNTPARTRLENERAAAMGNYSWATLQKSGLATD